MTLIIANSQPAIPAVQAAMRQNMRLAQALRFRIQTNKWIAANINEAEVAPVQTTMTQFMRAPPSSKCSWETRRLWA